MAASTAAIYVSGVGYVQVPQSSVASTKPSTVKASTALVVQGNVVMPSTRSSTVSAVPVVSYTGGYTPQVVQSAQAPTVSGINSPGLTQYQASERTLSPLLSATFASGIAANLPFTGINAYQLSERTTPGLGAALPNIPINLVPSNPTVRLTAGGVSAPVIPQSGAALASVPRLTPENTPNPAVRFTAGGLGPAQPAFTPLQSPDIVTQTGNVYAGPTGQVGPNEFVVTDLADVALITNANPGANVFYSNPNQPGPLQAVSGIASFIPALNQYLLGHDLPQAVIDALVRLGLLESEQPLFTLPGDGGVGGSGGFGTGFDLGSGFPSDRGLSAGLVNWRISA